MTKDSPYNRILDKNNVIFTPHMAWGAYEARRRCMDEILKNIETFFLVAKPELSFLSSSTAKVIAKFGGDITGFIPEVIEEEIKQKLYKK